MTDSKLENVLRKVVILLGVGLLVASIYLSYDGFDQKVTGGNADYSMLAKLIGIALAVTFSALEFVLSSRYENLNSTLKTLGLFAYGYSIWTNFLGAQHLLQMDNIMAIIVALFMDIVPEPMIAWGLGEALMGDLLGNIGKFAAAPVGKGKSQGQTQQQSRPQQTQPKPNNFQHQGPKPQYRPGPGPNNNGHKPEKAFHSFASSGGEEDD